MYTSELYKARIQQLLYSVKSFNTLIISEPVKRDTGDLIDENITKIRNDSNLMYAAIQHLDRKSFIIELILEIIAEGWDLYRKIKSIKNPESKVRSIHLSLLTKQIHSWLMEMEDIVNQVKSFLKYPTEKLSQSEVKI